MFCFWSYFLSEKISYFIFTFINIILYTVISWLKMNLLKILLQRASTDAILFLCYQKDLRTDTINTSIFFESFLIFSTVKQLACVLIFFFLHLVNLILFPFMSLCFLILSLRVLSCSFILTLKPIIFFPLFV